MARPPRGSCTRRGDPRLPLPRPGPRWWRRRRLPSSFSVWWSDSGGWTAGASAARPGEGGRNSRRQGVPRETYGAWDLDFPPISAPARPPRPACSPSSVSLVSVVCVKAGGREGSGGRSGSWRGKMMRCNCNLPAPPAAPGPESSPVKDPRESCAPRPTGGGGGAQGAQGLGPGEGSCGGVGGGEGDGEEPGRIPQQHPEGPVPGAPQVPVAGEPPSAPHPPPLPAHPATTPGARGTGRGRAPGARRERRPRVPRPRGPPRVVVSSRLVLAAPPGAVAGRGRRRRREGLPSLQGEGKGQGLPPLGPPPPPRAA